MNTPFALIALCACVLTLGACDKTPPTDPTPVVNSPVPTESGVTAGAVANPTVPSAASVFPRANPTEVNPTAERSNSTMSATQESTAMPMPRQNNDHSAPLGPAKPASSP